MNRPCLCLLGEASTDSLDCDYLLGVPCFKRCETGRARKPLLTVAIILILILFAHTVNEWFREFETDVMFNASDLAPIWSGLTVAIGLFGFWLPYSISGELSMRSKVSFLSSNCFGQMAGILGNS